MKNKTKKKAAAINKKAVVWSQLNMRVHPNIMVTLVELKKHKRVVKELKGKVSYPRLVGFALQYLRSHLR